MKNKKIKGWAVATARGTLTGFSPYLVYREKGNAEIIARMCSESSGSKRIVVPCEIIIKKS